MASNAQLMVRIGALIVVALNSLAASIANASDRPNVIVVITDDQGYADFSCHGHPVLKTPNIDRLYTESLRLVDFHVAPMCTPTRGQLLTGVDCLRNGAMNVSSGRTFLRREFPTMGDLFAAGGYRTGAFGKWHLGDNYPYRPQDRGFQESVWYPSSHIGSAPDFWNNAYFDDMYWQNGQRKKFHGYTTDVFFDEALRWMRGCADRREPFLCYLATAAAHGPLFVPEKYRAQYRGQRENVARFFGMIANIDDNMGRVEQFLRDTGIRDNTIVVFLTDNGGTVGVPTFNAGMRGSKITLYEGGHRVPCFLRWPQGNLRSPGNIHGLTEVQDLLPTLVELCGLDPAGDSNREMPKFDGVSLVPVLRGRTESPPERTLFVQFSRMQQPEPKAGDACVMWRRWRLVNNDELYDLESDPAQTQNVLDAHPAIAQKLRQEYTEWWTRLGSRVNERSALIMGSEAENPMQLSPADWEDSFLDQGRQIRDGIHRNGAWNVVVDRAGEYEFEVRRWSRETDAPFRAPLPAVKHADGEFTAGVALPIAQVRLKIGDFEARRDVTVTDKSLTFSTTLTAGRTRLQTWMLDADGKELAGAYYVYVQRK